MRTTGEEAVQAQSHKHENARDDESGLHDPVKRREQPGVPRTHELTEREPDDNRGNRRPEEARRELSNRHAEDEGQRAEDDHLYPDFKRLSCRHAHIVPKRREDAGG